MDHINEIILKPAEQRSGEDQKRFDKYRLFILNIMNQFNQDVAFKTDIEEVQVKLWMKKLAKYTASQIQEGFLKHLEIVGQKNLPTIGDFMYSCDHAGENVSVDLLASEAFALLVRNLNHTVVPVFKDKVAEEVLNLMGGWRNACLWETDSINWKRKEFIEQYKVLMQESEEIRANFGSQPRFNTNKPLKFIGGFSDDEKHQVRLEYKPRNDSLIQIGNLTPDEVQSRVLAAKERFLENAKKKLNPFQNKT